MDHDVHEHARVEGYPLHQVDSQEDPFCHINLPSRCMEIAPYLNSPCDLPTLWHEDVSLQNIVGFRRPQTSNCFVAFLAKRLHQSTLYSILRA